VIPKILFVVCGNSGTAWWRMFNWHEAFNRTGSGLSHTLGWDKNELGMSPWQYQIGDTQHQPHLFGALYGACLQADVIIFQRLETEWALTTMYALRDQFPDKPILSEFDDDVFDVAAYNPASEHIKPGSPTVKISIAQIENSDGLIVSTPYLADVYGEYCKSVYVIPNSVEVKKWDAAPRKRKPGIRIGWIGGASHAEDLRLLETVVPKITAISNDVRFVFSSSMVPDFLRDLPGVECVEKWSPIVKYPAHLAGLDFDIGLAPLRDNKFNRAKSNLRWLEYGALGIPCVASDVGHFKETIRHGVDGFLAKTPDEMAEQVELLVRNAKLRKRVGAEAHARIERDFNIDRNVHLYAAAVKDVLSRPAKSAPSLMTGVDEVRALDVVLEDSPGVEYSPLQRIEEAAH
jgi:glycosyltransferase involved in cell wall biosynthesis